MQVQNHLFDIVRRTAVVVDDGHTRDGLEQRLRFDLVGPVGVDDDEKAAAVGFNQRILSGDECCGKIGRGLQLRKQRARGVIVLVDDDARLFLPLAAQTHKPHGRAERVKVCHAVAHDKNLARLRNQLGQRARHHAGFYARMALGLLGAPAIEREIVAVFDDGLVAAARERHFNRQRGKRIVLFKRRAVLADAERDCRGDTRGICDLADAVENRELALLQPLQVLVFKDEQVPVALDFAAQRVQAVDPCADGLIDLRVEL